MALTLGQYKEANPEWKGMSDDGLFNRLHRKYYSDIPKEDLAKEIGYTIPAPVEEAKPEVEEQGNVSRGFSHGMDQVPQLLWGALGGAAAGAETTLGEGGFATGLKEAGVKKYQEASKELEATSKPSDSLTFALDEAKKGNLEAFTDWMGYGLGYVASQGVQAAATFGLGSLVGKQVLKSATTEVVASLVEKEAAKIIAKQEAAKIAAERAGLAVGEQLSGEALASQATSNLATRYAEAGGKAFLAGHAFTQEGGEIGGDLAEQSVKRGTPLTAEEAAKGLGWTIAAGGLEFAGDMFGINAVMGKSKLINKITGFADEAPGLLGRAQRGVAAGVIGSGVEGGQEGLQTIAENYGEGKDPFNEEGKRDIFDSIGLGMFGGGVAGGIGGTIKAPKDHIAEIGSATNVDEAITATGNSLNDNPEPLRISPDRNSALARNNIVFSDGSETPAGQFYQERLAEHGDDERARGETFIALNGHPKPVTGIPQLIFTADGTSVDKSHLIKTLTDQGLTTDEINGYLGKLVNSPVEYRTGQNFDPVKYLNERNSKTTAPITAPPVDDTTEELPFNNVLNNPSLVTNTNIGALGHFKAEQESIDRERLIEENTQLSRDNLQGKVEEENQTNNLVEARKKKTEENRLNLFASILHDDSVVNKKAKFEADLKRLYPNSDPTLTQREDDYLNNHFALLNSDQISKENTEPSSPDEGGWENHVKEKREVAPTPNKPVGTDTTGITGSESPIIEAKTEPQAPLVAGDIVSHATKGNGVIQSKTGQIATVKWDDPDTPTSVVDVKKLVKQTTPLPPLHESAPSAVTNSPVKSETSTKEESNHGEKTSESTNTTNAKEEGLLNPKESITHNGVLIYPHDRTGKKLFAVQTEDNKQRSLKGERTIVGDGLFDTLDEAKSYADEQNGHEADKVKRNLANEESDKKAQEAKAEHNNIDGFGDTLLPHHKAKAIKDLNKQVRIAGVVDSIKNHVRNKVEKGETTSSYEEDKIKPMKRRDFNNATQAEQDAHDKRIKESGKKTTYQVGNHNLGKTAHDYANYLINKKNDTTEETKPVLPDTGTGAEGEIKTEGANEAGQDNEGIKKKELIKTISNIRKTHPEIADIWDGILNIAENNDIPIDDDILSNANKIYKDIEIGKTPSIESLKKSTNDLRKQVELKNSNPTKEKSNGIDSRLDPRITALFMAEKVNTDIGDGNWAMIPRQELLDDRKEDVKNYKAFLDCLKGE